MTREPERTCVGCRGRSGKAALLRLAISAGRVVVDKRGTVSGRGAYVHLDPGCLRLALDRGALAHALATALDGEEVARLHGEIEGAIG